MENYSTVVQELISSYSAMACDMSLELLFLHSHLDFFLKTLELSAMNMEKVSIRIFPKLKSTVENGVEICWLTAAGVL